MAPLSEQSTILLILLAPSFCKEGVNFRTIFTTTDAHPLVQIKLKVHLSAPLQYTNITHEYVDEWAQTNNPQQWQTHFMTHEMERSHCCLSSLLGNGSPLSKPTIECQQFHHFQAENNGVHLRVQLNLWSITSQLGCPQLLTTLCPYLASLSSASICLNV